mmetsp:Transcript_6127/g.13556  ORF Transcript_6127/g.13556 Transcript_6127/m.13556 type:complete len:304 (+) Transcript_6127:358-1269(+)
MVRGIAIFQAAQDGDGHLQARLRHHHLLESPLQGGILLNILAIFSQCRCTDATQLSTGKHRLEQVCGVHRPIGLPRADEQVRLVDKKDNFSLSGLDFLQNSLEPLLKLAPVLGATDQGPHVQSNQTAAFQSIGNVLHHDALSKALSNRGLAHTRLSYENGVVLRATGQHLDDAADLLVPTNDRVELPCLSVRHEIPAVFEQCFEVRVCRLAVHLATSAQLLHSLLQLRKAETRLGEHFLHTGLLADGQEEVRQGEVRVAMLFLKLLGLFQSSRHSIVRQDRFGRRALRGESTKEGTARAAQIT